jgi:restriction endonuclease Mrr
MPVARWVEPAMAASMVSLTKIVWDWTWIYIQAKRWEGTVGRPEIQKFAGALQGQRARKGIFHYHIGFHKRRQ